MKLLISALTLALAAAISTPAFAVSTALSIVTTTEAGLTVSPVAADTTNGNSYDNTNGDVILMLQNTHATNAETFNIAVQNASVSVVGLGTMTKSNPLAIVVPALGIVFVGPLPKRAYNDASNLVQITYSGTGTPKVLPVRGLNLQYAGG